MATIFPASPAVNDTFESDGTTWKWNGSAWTFFSGAGTVGGGGDATVAFQTTQPDVASLDAGALWIDSDEDAISGLLPATFTRWIKILSASATTISGLDDNALSLLYTAGYEKVFINGTLLVRGSDYTASTGNTIVLTTAAESGDSVEVHAYESFQIADTYTQAAADAKFFPIDESRVDRWTKTFGASAMAISGSDDYAQTLDYTSGLESLFINGVLVDPSEYTRTSASVITMDEAILSGDVVDVISPKAFEVANTYTIAQIDAKYNNRTRWTKTYSASATVISGVDDNANTLSYTSGYEEVYLNGILLTPITDYARTSASVVTLGSAVAINDIIDVVNIQPFNVADVYTEAESDAKYLTQVSASTTYAPVAAGGLVLLNTTSFNAVASQQINSIFSTTYDNYFVYIKISSMVGGQDDFINLQFGTSGTINTSSTYRRNLSELGISNNVTTVNSTDNQTTLFAGIINVYGQITLNIGSPFLSERTWVRGNCDTSDRAIQILSGFFDNTTSFTDFKITKDGVTSMTGTVSVYGYKK